MRTGPLMDLGVPWGEACEAAALPLSFLIRGEPRGLFLGEATLDAAAPLTAGSAAFCGAAPCGV